MPSRSDPTWFGLMVIVLLEIGMLTPPLGLNVFIVKSVVGDEVTLGKAFSGAMPFFVGYLVAAALLIAFPIIVLSLPNMMYK